MKILVKVLVIALVAVTCAAADGKSAKPAGRTFIVVFDFSGGKIGRQLADKVRLRLRRHKDCEVIDRLTTQEFSGPLSSQTDRKKVVKLMKSLACRMAIYGTAKKVGQDVAVEARCIDLRDPKRAGGWKKVFSDSTERSCPLIARRIVETVRGKKEWIPPQYGDEEEPKAAQLGKSLNINGDFEKGRKGWDQPDNVSTFLVKGPKRRGTILRVRTDLKRDPWLEYRRKILLGKADTSKPPKIARDTSYGSVAGLEGVHFCSHWIKATAGQRYWLMADCKGLTAGMFFPKVFVKGFKDWSAHADGLPESSLAALSMTPKQFADLSKAEQKKLVANDIKKHPERYRRECYRWYLACRCETGWNHFAAPFPPRGGLPKNVQWLQIQIYSYWPPGEYLWDNVLLYKDPKQKTPLAEEKPRTKNFDKR